MGLTHGDPPITIYYRQRAVKGTGIIDKDQAEILVDGVVTEGLEVLWTGVLAITR